MKQDNENLQITLTKKNVIALNGYLDEIEAYEAKQEWDFDDLMAQKELLGDIAGTIWAQVRKLKDKM